LFRAATVSTLALVLLSTLVSNHSLGQNRSTLNTYLQRRCLRIQKEFAHDSEQKWNALAKLAEGKTIEQLHEILPAYRPTPPRGKLSAPIVTLWNGQTFYTKYRVDVDFEIVASGYSNAKGDVVISVSIIRSNS
jgi:hypothetical protein